MQWKIKFGASTSANREADRSQDLAQRAAQSLVGLAEITAVFGSSREILIKADPVTRLSGMDNIIIGRLAGFGYKTEVLSTEPRLLIRFSPLEIAAKRITIPWLNIMFFAITVCTTLLAGALQEGKDIFSNTSLWLHPSQIFLAGLPFSISLLSILLFHEFGHYAAARFHKVNVTLPLFIPAPTILGTFGAFIRCKSAFMNRRQLLDVAATGPLAGLLVAVVVLVIGINGSTFQPMPDSTAGAMFFGDSLLHQLITYLVKGPAPENSVLMINSIAFAGWVGLLVTMFNLLPIGQLDGGHIMYALFGKNQKYLAYAAMATLIVLSFWWIGWAFWLIMALLLKPIHPPTMMDEIDIGKGRRVIGYLSIAAFILCFMPVPVTYL